MPPSDAWPALPYEAWRPTKETLHRYAQILGKLRMSLVPFRNHWWHATLYVSARGLTTGPMPYGTATFDIELDVLEDRLRVRTSDGRAAEFGVRDGFACASFHGELATALDDVGVHVDVPTVPFDLGDSAPFDEDIEHAAYDGDAVRRYWTILRRTEEVLAELGTDFAGKASPTHLFWHSFDIAHARFNGRRAPAIPGADHVTAVAYSHEVIAFGWWPGDARRTPYPAFYSYTAPEPPGLREQPLAPAAAAWSDTGNGSLALLAYDDALAEADPAAAVAAFFDSAYRAGARAAGWDVEALAG